MTITVTLTKNIQEFDIEIGKENCGTFCNSDVGSYFKYQPDDYGYCLTSDDLRNIASELDKLNGAEKNNG